MDEKFRKTKKFLCPVCGKDFDTKRQLKNHKLDKCGSKLAIKGCENSEVKILEGEHD